MVKGMTDGLVLCFSRVAVVHLVASATLKLVTFTRTRMDYLYTACVALKQVQRATVVQEREREGNKTNLLLYCNFC